MESPIIFMVKKQKTSIKEVKKLKVKEIKRKIEIQELAMKIKSDLPPLEAEESLEEKLMKKQLRQFGKVEEDKEEEEFLPVKNLEDDLEDLLKEDKDEKNDASYVSYGEINKDYEKVESIKGYMVDPNRELTQNQILKNEQRAINREIENMSEDIRITKNSKRLGEELLPTSRSKFSQFRNMSEDYR